MIASIYTHPTTVRKQLDKRLEAFKISLVLTDL